MLTVVATCAQVYSRYHQKVDSNAEVCKGQVVHEEARHCHLAPAGEEDQEHRQVACDGQYVDKPNGHSEKTETRNVLTGIESICFRCANQFTFSVFIEKVSDGLTLNLGL